MSTKRNMGGRPPLAEGGSEMVWAYVPPEHRALVLRLHEQTGASRSQIVAALIAVGINHLQEAELPAKRPPAEQEELPLVQQAKAS